MFPNYCISIRHADGSCTNILAMSYAGLSFAASDAVQVIGPLGVIIAAKNAGDTSLTVH